MRCDLIETFKIINGISYYVLWSRGGSNDNTTRKCVIRNILKENSTCINDNWEKPPLQLNTIMYITVLGESSMRLRRRELESVYVT